MTTTLNPVQFGAEVIDQFGRYLQTTFPIADPGMEQQVQQALRHSVGGERLIAKGPYVHISRPFEEGPSVQEMVDEKALGLHAALPSVFRFDSLHKHQELALRHARNDKHVIVATGTGSGKTEAFLLPVIDHCLKMRTANEQDGVAAVVVYPMNALADDQLRRLRTVLAGTRITFGRYTGATPEGRDAVSGIKVMEHARKHTAEEKALLDKGRDEQVPRPWEECLCREEIRDRKPRILLTNYSQLEYLLLRDRDLDLFRNAPLRFLVFDEVHTYTGALGSEVACLIRRLRHVAGKSPDQTLCIGTSATVQDTDGKLDAKKATHNFAQRLFGIPEANIELVTERYQRTVDPDEDLYVPPPPKKPRELLTELLTAVRELQLQDEVAVLPDEVLALTERLAGRAAPTASTAMLRAYSLLAGNALVATLGDLFAHPTLIAQAMERVRLFSRRDVDDDDLVAEILAYLILGALVQQEDEPLLRPKLHYFVQGFHGLAVAFGDDGKPQVHFDAAAGQTEDGRRIFPLVLCRSCGQHYVPLFTMPPDAIQQESGDVTGIRLTRCPDAHEEPGTDESLVYITDRLVGLSEEGTRTRGLFLCRGCGTLHEKATDACLHPHCDYPGPLLPVHVHEGTLSQCLACDTTAKGYDEIVTPAQSSEVADVTILAQSMLSAMPEEPLQKLLIFSDNRQDAAFQAGWMNERSRRFRLRHVLYSVLAKDPGVIWSLEKLTEEVTDEGYRRGVLEAGEWDDDNNLTRIRWFLLEEFASTGQRRNSLESLALAQVHLKEKAPAAFEALCDRWTRLLDTSLAGLANAVQLILDYYRRRGMVSDPLMARRWTPLDREARKRLINTHDHYRPQALVLEKPRGSRDGYTKGFIASNGRSAAQEMLRKAVGRGGKDFATERNEFLTELWGYLVEHQVLVPVKLVWRRQGKIVPIHVTGTPHQINVALVGVGWTDSRQTCPSCRRSQAVAPDNGACPEYGCKGTLEGAGRDGEHYDVHQYTRGRFVALKTREHTAQVPKDQRAWIEAEFKKTTGGKVNTLVCTPTLEMGVDIGKLEMVLMRNAPPTPANYAQRAGRAGRRHRIAVVFSYCRGSSHDRYFFADPPAMIAGEIRVPAFSMRNEPLIRKHVHSTALTALRAAGDAKVVEALDHAFPPFVREYVRDMVARVVGGQEKQKPRFLDKPRDLTPFRDCVTDHHDALLGHVRAVFQSTWPEDDGDAVSDAALGQLLDDASGELGRHVKALHQQVTAYRDKLKELSIQEHEGGLDTEEKKRQDQYRHALKRLMSVDQDNYTLSYLSVDGFFPGYAMARQSVTARCPEPYLEISRPATVALRELTPANFLYANRNVFRVRRLSFHRLKAEDKDASSEVQRRQLVFHPNPDRIEEPGTAKTEGGEDAKPMTVDTQELTDVELRPKQPIDDREKGRHRVGFVVHGMALAQHAGGREAKAGMVAVRLLARQTLRLVNLGVPGKGGVPFSLFPICPGCGATRSPRASDAELTRFAEDHLTSCEVETGRYALHVDFRSDALHIGPFHTEAEATNLFEGIRVGARLVLDMGSTEIEGLTLAHADGQFWALLFDPMPGGSGFLPQIVEYWEVICEKGREAMEKCPSGCETSCYACLRHFRNQQAHDLLDRHMASKLLTELGVPLDMSHVIPPVAVQAEAKVETTDSDSEENFAAICKKRGFPVPPVGQYRVDLDGGSYTIADWAYPTARVLVYIDGMSEKYHGSAKQQMKDALITAKLQMAGWHVVRITSEGLQDEGTLSGKLEEIGVYLGKEV